MKGSIRFFFRLLIMALIFLLFSCEMETEGLSVTFPMSCISDGSLFSLSGARNMSREIKSGSSVISAPKGEYSWRIDRPGWTRSAWLEGKVEINHIGSTLLVIPERDTADIFFSVTADKTHQTVLQWKSGGKWQERKVTLISDLENEIILRDIAPGTLEYRWKDEGCLPSPVLTRSVLLEKENIILTRKTAPADSEQLCPAVFRVFDDKSEDAVFCWRKLGTEYWHEKDIRTMAESHVLFSLDHLPSGPIEWMARRSDNTYTKIQSGSISKTSDNIFLFDMRDESITEPEIGIIVEIESDETKLIDLCWKSDEDWTVKRKEVGMAEINDLITWIGPLEKGNWTVWLEDEKGRKSCVTSLRLSETSARVLLVHKREQKPVEPETPPPVEPEEESVLGELVLLIRTDSYGEAELLYKKNGGKMQTFPITLNHIAGQKYRFHNVPAGEFIYSIRRNRQTLPLPSVKIDIVPGIVNHEEYMFLLNTDVPEPETPPPLMPEENTKPETEDKPGGGSIVEPSRPEPEKKPVIDGYIDYETRGQSWVFSFVCTSGLDNLELNWIVDGRTRGRMDTLMIRKGGTEKEIKLKVVSREHGLLKNYSQSLPVPEKFE